MPTMPISDVVCLFFGLVDVEQQKRLMVEAGNNDSIRGELCQVKHCAVPTAANRSKFPHSVYWRGVPAKTSSVMSFARTGLSLRISVRQIRLPPSAKLPAH
jgi:hypothetical protein